MKKIKILLAITFILVVAGLCLLSFAPSQTHKYVFMWQAYVYPNQLDSDGHEILVYSWAAENSYTGSWKSWNKDGSLLFLTSYKDGYPEDIYCSFHENGEVENFAHHREGDLEGVSLLYSDNGELKEVYFNDKVIYMLGTSVDYRSKYKDEIEKAITKLNMLKKKLILQ